MANSWVPWKDRSPENRAKYLASIKESAERNKEERAKRRSEYNANNPAKERIAFRLSDKDARKCAPKWLTKEQWQQMNQFYFEARRLTKETGVQYVVDHIWSLEGWNSCGLHVPWNLQIITKLENDAKQNKDPHE